MSRTSVKPSKAAKHHAFKIEGCARCGSNHQQLVFNKLFRPAEDFDYWALCPTTGEPVIMKVYSV